MRHGWGWRDGEDLFFRHLLDGSRAANRAGWQWTVGALTGKPYGFSRWQVEKRAPELCRRCPVSDACPIQDWPEDQRPEPRSMVDPRMRRDDDVEATAGPVAPQVKGRPEAVWITAESLGRDDPALTAHADLPVVVPEVLADVGPVAATFTPVPGWRRTSARVTIAATYPWPWLRRPHGGSITSFTAWSKSRASRR